MIPLMFERYHGYVLVEMCIQRTAWLAAPHVHRAIAPTHPSLAVQHNATHPVTVLALTSSSVRFVMRYLEIKSSRLTVAEESTSAQFPPIVASPPLEQRRRLTVPTTHPPLTREFAAAVQDAPVVEDCDLRSEKPYSSLGSW